MRMVLVVLSLQFMAAEPASAIQEIPTPCNRVVSDRGAFPANGYIVVVGSTSIEETTYTISGGDSGGAAVSAISIDLLPDESATQHALDLRGFDDPSLMVECVGPNGIVVEVGPFTKHDDADDQAPTVRLVDSEAEVLFGGALVGEGTPNGVRVSQTLELGDDFRLAGFFTERRADDGEWERGQRAELFTDDGEVTAHVSGDANLNFVNEEVCVRFAFFDLALNETVGDEQCSAIERGGCSCVISGREVVWPRSVLVGLGFLVGLRRSGKKSRSGLIPGGRAVIKQPGGGIG